MPIKHDAAWARSLPDEILLHQLWISAVAAFLRKDNAQAVAEATVLGREVKHRGLEAAVLPVGKTLRDALHGPVQR